MKKVDAMLACRVQGARLYAKPLQTLVPGGITVIESLLDYLESAETIDRIILCIAEGNENEGFIKLAKERNYPYVVGDEQDVLGRILAACKKYDSSHLLRITTEGPFVISDYIDKIVLEFLEGDYDWASYEDAPEGTCFELIKTEALEISHSSGEDRHRSELVTSFICENQDQFNLLFKTLPESLRRPEVRLTVDYAEDLVFCQAVYNSLKQGNELISIDKIIDFWDNNPDVRKPVESIGLDWGTGRLAWTDSDKAKASDD